MPRCCAQLSTMADSPVPGIGQLLADVQLIERLGDVIPGLVYVYDLSERCNVYTNRALCELLGYSPAQMRGMGDAVVRTIVHPEDAPTVSEHYARIIRESGGGVSELEYRIRSSAGRLYWLHTWESVLADPDGRARFVLGVAQDVTARVAGEETLREAMQALLESEQRWRSIVENPFDFVVVIDREYKYTFVNFVAPGLQLEDLLGKATPFDFIASSDHERVRAALDGVFELAPGLVRGVHTEPGSLVSLGGRSYPAGHAGHASVDPDARDQRGETARGGTKHA